MNEEREGSPTREMSSRDRRWLFDRISESAVGERLIASINRAGGRRSHDDPPVRLEYLSGAGSSETTIYVDPDVPKKRWPQAVMRELSFVDDFVRGESTVQKLHELDLSATEYVLGRIREEARATAVEFTGGMQIDPKAARSEQVCKTFDRWMHDWHPEVHPDDPAYREHAFAYSWQRLFEARNDSWRAGKTQETFPDFYWKQYFDLKRLPPEPAPDWQPTPPVPKRFTEERRGSARRSAESRPPQRTRPALERLFGIRLQEVEPRRAAAARTETAGSARRSDPAGHFRTTGGWERAYFSAPRGSRKKQ